MEKGERYSILLTLLADTGENSLKTRKAIISGGEAGLIQLISEIALNILQGKLSISYYYKRKLSVYADVIRKISSRKTKRSQRRYLCHSNSEAVALMLKAVLPHIQALIKSHPDLLS